MAEQLFEIDISKLASGELTPDSVTTVDPSSKQGDNKPPKDNNTNEPPEKEEQEGIDISILENLGAEGNTTGDDNQPPGKKDPVDNQGGNTSSSGSDATSSSNYSALVGWMVEAGILSNIDEEVLEKIDGQEALSEALRTEISAREYRDLTEEQKTYLEALRTGIPEQEVKRVQSNVKMYMDLKEENITSRKELQMELFKREYMTRGFSQERAILMATRDVENPNAGQLALESRNFLVDHENALMKEEILQKQKEMEEQKAKEREALLDLKDKINKADEVLPGIKVNSSTKDKIFESITRLEQTERGFENELMKRYATDEEFKMKLHAVYVLTKGLKNLDKFVKTSKTQAVKQLDQQINSGFFGTQGSSGKFNRGSGGNKTAEEIAQAWSNQRK